MFNIILFSVNIEKKEERREGGEKQFNCKRVVMEFFKLVCGV